ncbi:fungal-specific transcription factor domain-containing protein [Aspergillus granulosus]|uniref:Fungal-specific transcription factor domain-containing protein n=1 Tax=Aspergillus granulosus TaxID=176169 RepID=A0ABR4HI62_9EURO
MLYIYTISTFPRVPITGYSITNNNSNRNCPACITRREKCRKCDRGRLKYQQYISKGLVCQEYPDQFQFCRIASRGKWKNARIPTSKTAALPSPPGPSPPGLQTTTTPSQGSTPPASVVPRTSRSIAIKSILLHPVPNIAIGLLYAILGLSAVHLGRLTNNWTLIKTTSVEYRLKAIRALKKNCIFATIQVILLHDSGILEHGIHITGAMSVCKPTLISEGFNSQHQRAVFFIKNLAWLDIIYSFAKTQRLCFTQDICKIVASVGGDQFKLVNRYPREIFLIIGSVLEKVKKYKIDWTTDKDFQSTLIAAKFELHAWDAKNKMYPSPDLRWTNIATAFQYTCILHVHHLLDPTQPASSPEIQAAVAQVLDSTANIPANCSLIELLILPLFMAGADTLSRHSQFYILSRFQDIKQCATRFLQICCSRSGQRTCFPELPQQHNYLII